MSNAGVRRGTLYRGSAAVRAGMLFAMVHFQSEAAHTPPCRQPLSHFPQQIISNCHASGQTETASQEQQRDSALANNLACVIGRR